MKPNPYNKNINCIAIFKLTLWWESTRDLHWRSLRWGGDQHKNGLRQGKTILYYNHGLQVPWYAQRHPNSRNSRLREGRTLVRIFLKNWKAWGEPNG